MGLGFGVRVGLGLGSGVGFGFERATTRGERRVLGYGGGVAGDLVRA